MSVNRKEGKEVTKRVSVWLFYSEPENSGIESQLLDLVLILTSPMNMRHGNCAV